MSAYTFRTTLSANPFYAPRSIFAVNNSDVGAIQRMAPLAMGFRGIMGLPRAAVEDGVLTGRYHPKMGGPHASRGSTDMVNEIALRDRANMVFVRPAMGAKALSYALLPSREVEDAVSILVPEGCPQPASVRLLDMAEEAFLCGHSNYCHVGPPITTIA